MTDAEIRARISATPEEDADEFDLEMLQRAETSNDETAIDGETFLATINECKGRISLRVPRSLHYRLLRSAQREGVSLNQYLLYKLAQ
ncbi:hypothetical protein AGMMS49992_22630 [Clostridia bacterium]|nr:hypothetical protein AGMMS49992_22630 [Clostridia bacterium]